MENTDSDFVNNPQALAFARGRQIDEMITEIRKLLAGCPTDRFSAYEYGKWLSDMKRKYNVT